MLDNGFLRPDGAAPRRVLPRTTPKAEVKEEVTKKEDIERWVQSAGMPITSNVEQIVVTGATGATDAIAPNNAAPPSNAPQPASQPNIYAQRLEEEVKREREEMKKRMEEEMKRRMEEEVQRRVQEEAAKTAEAEQKLQQMHLAFSRQMKDRIEQNEMHVRSIQNQAKMEIERADKEREAVAAAAVEMEMQKVRQREGEVERQLREIAERQKARQNQEQADCAVVAQQQQRAEQQIADLKKELKKQ